MVITESKIASVEFSRKHFVSQQPPILPWVGTRYASAKPRILLVYEASYASETGDYAPGNEESQFCWFADAQANEKDQTLFKKSFEAMRRAGIALPKNNMEAIHDVAFCNFVQFIVSKENHRKRPTNTQIADSIQPFATILQTLRPDLVVAFGIGRVRSHVLRYLEAAGCTENELPLRYNGMVFASPQHPSGTFSYDESEALLREGLLLLEET